MFYAKEPGWPMEGLNPCWKYYVKRQRRLPPQRCAIIYTLLSFLPSLMSFSLCLSAGDFMVSGYLTKMPSIAPQLWMYRGQLRCSDSSLTTYQYPFPTAMPSYFKSLCGDILPSKLDCGQLLLLLLCLGSRYQTSQNRHAGVVYLCC